MEHPFWGNIQRDSSSCTAGITFSHPFFGKGTTEILLEPGPGNTMPDEDLLQAYAHTYTYFINSIGNRLVTLQQAMFEVYMEYLKPAEDNDIDTLQVHNDYIKELAFIRIGPNDMVELCFYYSLLNAPVHSVFFIGDQVYARYNQP
ncbi:hypothetical protein [Chitinophaga nivalis]|uniref:Uncharacterized protein n=1 Tax=Chitinophaga nivalis TaxID=2991709 RepID=A0ABT3IN53_9BACT|nr:hypothetical protein [Chitinophaga nivalis]MCW3464977.1 hypothetical protein [Chitinophaga nivalis]MCW3485331.1 hypothetical protein [Chitinophaga nivalis]